MTTQKRMTVWGELDVYPEGSELPVGEEHGQRVVVGETVYLFNSDDEWVEVGSVGQTPDSLADQNFTLMGEVCGTTRVVDGYTEVLTFHSWIRIDQHYKGIWPTEEDLPGVYGEGVGKFDINDTLLYRGTLMRLKTRVGEECWAPVTESYIVTPGSMDKLEHTDKKLKLHIKGQVSPGAELPPVSQFKPFEAILSEHGVRYADGVGQGWRSVVEGLDKYDLGFNWIPGGYSGADFYDPETVTPKPKFGDIFYIDRLHRVFTKTGWVDFPLLGEQYDGRIEGNRELPRYQEYAFKDILWWNDDFWILSETGHWEVLSRYRSRTRVEGWVPGKEKERPGAHNAPEGMYYDLRTDSHKPKEEGPFFSDYKPNAEEKQTPPEKPHNLLGAWPEGTAFPLPEHFMPGDALSQEGVVWRVSDDGRSWAALDVPFPGAMPFTQRDYRRYKQEVAIRRADVQDKGSAARELLTKRQEVKRLKRKLLLRRITFWIASLALLVACGYAGWVWINKQVVRGWETMEANCQVTLSTGNKKTQPLTMTGKRTTNRPYMSLFGQRWVDESRQLVQTVVNVSGDKFSVVGLTGNRYWERRVAMGEKGIQILKDADTYIFVTDQGSAAATYEGFCKPKPLQEAEDKDPESAVVN